MYTPDLLLEYGERYAAMPKRGLLVTARLADRVMVMNPVTLDGLLAWAVVHEAEGLSGEKVPFAAREDVPNIPLPLHCLWADDDGGPLWSASFFAADPCSVEDVEYFHKRAPDGFRTKAKTPATYGVKGVSGRWADRRTPFGVLVTRSIYASCVGNLDEVGRLLEYVTHIGKKASAGFGMVERWNIDPIDISPMDCVIRDGVLTRNVPCAWGAVLSDFSPVSCGWAPPYWNPKYYGWGWRFGTRSRPVAAPVGA